MHRCAAHATFLAVSVTMVSGIGDPAIPAGSSSFVTLPQFTVAANKKRAAPDPVEPITLGGVRYEAVQFGKARGLEQNGGYITATDVKTGNELWLIKIYDVRYVGDMEPDKQDVFISAMQLTGDRGHLEIENESGARFLMDLKTRHVQRIE
jgi:hypothetical protein